MPFPSLCFAAKVCERLHLLFNLRFPSPFLLWLFENCRTRNSLLRTTWPKYWSFRNLILKTIYIRFAYTIKLLSQVERELWIVIATYTRAIRQIFLNYKMIQKFVNVTTTKFIIVYTYNLCKLGMFPKRRSGMCLSWLLLSLLKSLTNYH